MDQDRIAVRVRLEGRVQGVWFRAWAERRAEDLGLDGWVRNRLDGSVEALFAGPAHAVEDMVAACRDGPPSAIVLNIAQEAAEAPAAGSGFQVLDTV